MSGLLTPNGAGTEEAMGLARARDLEAQHHARHLRGHTPVDRSNERQRPWGRLILIGLGLFVLMGWTLTIITAITS